MDNKSTRKPIIELIHVCFECGQQLSAAKTLLNHMKNAHSIDAVPRKPSNRRPVTDKYEYRKDGTIRSYDQARFSCPSCWYHCPAGDENLKRLKKHYCVEHLNYDPESKVMFMARNDVEGSVILDDDSYTVNGYKVSTVADKIANENNYNAFNKDRIVAKSASAVDASRMSSGGAGNNRVGANAQIDVMQRLEDLVESLKRLFT